MARGIGDVDGDVDAGALLDLQRMAKAAVFVAPGLDGEQMPADALEATGCRASGRCRAASSGAALPVLLVGRLPQQLGRQHVVAVGEDVGFDGDRPADDAADREARLLCGVRDR